MSEGLFYEAVERLVSAHFDRDTVRRGSRGDWQDDAWTAFGELGLWQAMTPADKGGVGLDLAEAADLVRLVGYWAIPLPLGDAMLATSLLASCDLSCPPGFLSIAPPHHSDVRIEPDGDQWCVEGYADRVAWGRAASAVIVLGRVADRFCLVVVPTQNAHLIESENLAGEPRDQISFSVRLGRDSVAEIDIEPSTLHAAGAALTAITLGGAAHRLLDMSVDFAREHRQFGRPIAQFQAIQQNLAVLAGHAAICRASADMAAEAFLQPDGLISIAMAKARAGEAAAEAAHLAHQIHGAIGFTEEYDVQLYSRRIWAWREEFGNEVEWNAVVGQAVVDDGAGPWALITQQSTAGRDA